MDSHSKRRSDYCGCVVCCMTITSHTVECASIIVGRLDLNTEQAVKIVLVQLATESVMYEVIIIFTCRNN